MFLRYWRVWVCCIDCSAHGWQTVSNIFSRRYLSPNRPQTWLTGLGGIVGKLQSSNRLRSKFNLASSTFKSKSKLIPAQRCTKNWKKSRCRWRRRPHFLNGFFRSFFSHLSAGAPDPDFSNTQFSSKFNQDQVNIQSDQFKIQFNPTQFNSKFNSKQPCLRVFDRNPNMKEIVLRAQATNRIPWSTGARHAGTPQWMRCAARSKRMNEA